jgi:hypothetical protein
MDANEIQGKPLNGRDELLLIRLLAIGYWLSAIREALSVICHFVICHALRPLFPYSEHSQLFLVDQCSGHRDRSIAEKEQG